MRTPPDPTDAMLTGIEAARMSGEPVSTFYRKLSDGRIPGAVQNGKTGEWVVPRASLERMARVNEDARLAAYAGKHASAYLIQRSLERLERTIGDVVERARELVAAWDSRPEPLTHAEFAELNSGRAPSPELRQRLKQGTRDPAGNDSTIRERAAALLAAAQLLQQAEVLESEARVLAHDAARAIRDAERNRPDRVAKLN